MVTAAQIPVEGMKNTCKVAEEVICKDEKASMKKANLLLAEDESTVTNIFIIVFDIFIIYF